jgi:hypothetical protein
MRRRCDRTIRSMNMPECNHVIRYTCASCKPCSMQYMPMFSKCRERPKIQAFDEETRGSCLVGEHAPQGKTEEFRRASVWKTAPNLPIRLFHLLSERIRQCVFVQSLAEGASAIAASGSRPSIRRPWFCSLQGLLRCNIRRCFLQPI